MTAYSARKEGLTIYLTEAHRASEDTSGPRPKIPEVPATLYHSHRVWPLVQFQSGRVMLCIPVTFEVYNADGKIEAQRVQASHLEIE